MTARRPEGAKGTPQPLFMAGDVDGFFGLAIDNLILLFTGLTPVAKGSAR